MGHSVGASDYCVGMVILMQMKGRRKESQQTGGNRAGDEGPRGGQV